MPGGRSRTGGPSAHPNAWIRSSIEVLGLDEYHRDPRFEAKKPVLRGTWQQRCGDNFYSLGADGRWIRHRTLHHLDAESRRQDTRFARIFIARKFWYLGRSAAPLPPEFAPLAGGRGVRVKHAAELVEAFRAWVATRFEPGAQGLPHDHRETLSHVGRACGDIRPS